MANLGFLSEEQKNNIWGLPRQTAFIDSGQATNLVQPEPQLLTDAVSSALNPNLKSKADQAQKVYQEAVQKALPYGNEYAGYLQFYKNQAARFQNEYDSAYGLSLIHI